MGNELIAYYKTYGDYGYTYYHKLRLTGKWKIESGPYYENKMFIQHKLRVMFIPFTARIDEDEITFLPREESIIFNCRG